MARAHKREFTAHGGFGQAGASGPAATDCTAASTQGSAGQVVLRGPADPDDPPCDTTGLIEVARQHLDIEYCASCNLQLQFQGAELLCKDPLLAAATASTQGGWARHIPVADGSGDDQRAHRHEHMPRRVPTVAGRHGRRAVRQGSIKWVAAACAAAAAAGARAWPPASSPVSKQRRDQRRLALLLLLVQGCQVPQGPRVHLGSCGTWQPWTSKAGAPAAADHAAASTQGWRLEARQENQHQQQQHHKQQQPT